MNLSAVIFFLNSKALKCELQRANDELKSSQLTIVLVVKGDNFTKLPRGQEQTVIKINITLWVLAVTKVMVLLLIILLHTNNHSDTIRRKYTQQSNNLFHYLIILKFMVTSLNHLTRQTTTFRRYIKPCVRRGKDLTLQQNTVLLVGDSHIRGVAVRLSFKLGLFFHTIGYVKPNANLNNITSSVKSEVKNLSKSYVVVLCGGTLDVARDDTMQGLSSVLQFVKHSEHTNVIIMDPPHRFDLGASSCVNKEVNLFNRKFNKIIKLCNHTGQLNLNMQRQHFTKHGLHMNGSGKDRITRLLTSRIMEPFTTHRLETPIARSWKAEITEEEEKEMRPITEKFKLTSPELQITEQGKHSNSGKQGNENVQNIDFDSANNTGHSTLVKMSSKGDIVFKDSDNSTKPLQITHQRQTNKQK
jgi:hypothetical protein